MNLNLASVSALNLNFNALSTNLNLNWKKNKFKFSIFHLFFGFFRGKEKRELTREKRKGERSLYSYIKGIGFIQLLNEEKSPLRKLLIS